MRRLIDLRSDTVTMPTENMRRAMAQAEVGDDVFREDPTVSALEEECAELLGYEAALFVPTGTMGNQISIHLLTRPGDEVLIEGSGHSYDWENSGMAVISGVQPRVLIGDRGVFDVDDVEEALFDRMKLQYLRAKVSLVIIENTHNMAGGRVWPHDRMAEVQQLARARGAALHLDGARLFNAAVASGTAVADLAAGFDTVMVSLSKGLCAPLGSILAGSAGLIDDGRRVRKLLGGGMRQVGVVAAAGRVAIAEMIDRLAEDHDNARRLAKGLTELPGVELAYGHCDSNIVIIDVADCDVRAEEIRNRLEEQGVVCLNPGSNVLRLVTHAAVNSADIDFTIGVAREVIGA